MLCGSRHESVLWYKTSRIWMLIWGTSLNNKWAWIMKQGLNSLWPWITNSMKCSSSLGDTSSITGSLWKYLTSTALVFIASILCPQGKCCRSWQNDYVCHNSGRCGGSERLGSWETQCWLWREETEGFPESECEVDDCYTCKAHAWTSEAPDAAARCWSCDNHHQEPSWNFGSVWSPHSDGTRDVGAMDPHQIIVSMVQLPMTIINSE